MKQIYNILSVLLILAMIGIGNAMSAPQAKPTPTANPETVQDARINSLETNDTMQQINNSEQQINITNYQRDINSLYASITYLGDLVHNLLDRVTSLEANDTLTGIYSNRTNGIWIYDFDNETEISNYNLNLKVPSYVYIEGSGMIDNCGADPLPIKLEVDGSELTNMFFQSYSSWGYDTHGRTVCYSLSGGSYKIPFHISSVTYLQSGIHSISLKANGKIPFYQVDNLKEYVDYAMLNIIVNQNGDIVNKGGGK